MAEFEQVFPAFQTAYAQTSPPPLTQTGQTRQRQRGGGATGALPQSEDQLFGLLVYHKTTPLHTMHGLPLGLSPPHAHAWMPRLLPVLPQALRDRGEAPERDARPGATSALARAGGADLPMDGSARRRQRPPENAPQQEHSSGKKKAHTDTHMLLVQKHTPKVGYLRPTVAGTTHAKQATDDAQMVYPTHATLDTDTGLQG